MKNTSSLFAALDLHSTTTVLGTLSADGIHSKPIRFPTTAEHLIAHVCGLGRDGVRLTLEASPLARWAAKLLRPHVEQFIVCEPRFNKLIGSDPHKRDENDVRSLCTLLSLGHLKEVWMGTDRNREILRHELKNLSYHAWRTACKSTTGDNAVKAFYHASLQRTGSVRHARLNTQRKLLEALWRMWLHDQQFDPKRVLTTSTQRPGQPVCRSAKAPRIP